MSNVLSESKPREAIPPPPRNYLRLATLFEWSKAPHCASGSQVMRLIAEVIRLRAKVRYQKRRILDLEGAPFELDLRRRDDLPPAAPGGDISPAVEEALGP